MALRRTPSRLIACALITTILGAPAPSFAATPDDPFEGFNRGMYVLHRALDHVIFGPAARAYAAVLPQQVRKGVRNIVTNLKEPGIAFNDLLQAHPGRAGRTAARFVVNSSIGVGGLLDMAHDLGLPHHDNGFGATAGRYGVQPGPYLFIPFVGPTNIRDLLGQIADTATDPLGWRPFNDGQVIYARAILDGLDQRAEADAQLTAIDNMSTDPYASLRSLFEQNRAAQINDARAGMTGSSEPSFDLLEDPGGTPADPGATPADPAAKTLPSEPRPGAMLENRMIDQMLSRPLTPRTMTLGALTTVEPAQAG
jgi:phospholipid-binding lipoprotein MlaA